MHCHYFQNFTVNIQEGSHFNEETTYGPLLLFFIEFGTVQEFNSLYFMIKNNQSNPKLLSHNMLLSIKSDNSKKIKGLLLVHLQQLL